MSELEPAEEPESTQPCAPREDSAPRAPRKPRVKQEPVESATQEPADPMLFAGLNDTLKKMVQAERRHRLSYLKFV